MRDLWGRRTDAVSVISLVIYSLTVADRRGERASVRRPWTTACPRPRAISHRFTGKVTTHATASATARLPQNSQLSSDASIAPGMRSSIALSTISMTAIEAVSATSARPSAARSAMPEATSGQIVRL